MEVCWPEMPSYAHTRNFFVFSQEIITLISSLHSRLLFRRRLIRVTMCVHRNFYQRLNKNELLHRRSLKWKWTADGRGFDPPVRQHGDWSWKQKFAEFLGGFSRSFFAKSRGEKNCLHKLTRNLSAFSPRKFAFKNFCSRIEREKRACFLGWSVNTHIEKVKQQFLH